MITEPRTSHAANPHAAHKNTPPSFLCTPRSPGIRGAIDDRTRGRNPKKKWKRSSKEPRDGKKWEERGDPRKKERERERERDRDRRHRASVVCGSGSGVARARGVVCVALWRLLKYTCLESSEWPVPSRRRLTQSKYNMCFS